MCNNADLIALQAYPDPMLLQFSVSNFRCFRQHQTLSLAASSHDRSLPENRIEREFPGVKSRFWLKGAAIYGANASGKSTMLEALGALRNLVIGSAARTDPEDPIPEIEPFALTPSEPESPTTFTIAFATGETRFEYRLAATRKRIWHESLRAFPEGKAQVWYARDWSPESGTYAWSPDRPTGFERDRRLERDTLGNVLFLSKHISSNRSELEPVFRWFKNQLLFLDLSTRAFLSFDQTLRQIERGTDLAQAILSVLRHADVGITGARTVDYAPPKEMLDLIQRMPKELQEDFRKQSFRRPELLHRAGAAEVPLPYDSESAGTQRLFALAGPWLEILANGRTVLMDELETSMHPLLVAELLRLLFSGKTNPNGAQILFTTHNPLLLDPTLLRRDQIWFTDKNREGEARIYPLTDYSPRNRESLVRGYLSGRYGGIPFLPGGLTGTRAGFERTEATDEIPDRTPKTRRRKSEAGVEAPA